MLAGVDEVNEKPNSYPIVGWGKNRSGVCAECGREIKSYDSSYQTTDGSKLFHPECVSTEPYHSKYPNLVYYSDG